MEEIFVEFKNYKPPTFDIWCMKLVYLVSERSKDPRTKIGAVLIKERNIISTGYNGFPIDVNDLEERYLDRETKLDYIVHAEHNVVNFCARFGIPSMGSILYTNYTPCNNCTKSIIQGGISEVVIHKQWGDYAKQFNHKKCVDQQKISFIMLNEAKIKIRILDEFLGVKGYLDGKIINI